MTKDQKIVLAGSLSGIATMVVAVSLVYHVWPHGIVLIDTASRLAYALQAGLLAAIPLMVGIAIVANNRFLTEAIDPTLHKEDTATVINGRVLDNTLQQFVVFLVAILALSVNLPAEQMTLIPAAAVVFVIARVVFWIGYRIHPLYRAPGMGATLYLNMGLLAFAAWSAWNAGPYAMLMAELGE